MQSKRSNDWTDFMRVYFQNKISNKCWRNSKNCMKKVWKQSPKVSKQKSQQLQEHFPNSSKKTPQQLQINSKQVPNKFQQSSNKVPQHLQKVPNKFQTSSECQKEKSWKEVKQIQRHVQKQLNNKHKRGWENITKHRKQNIMKTDEILIILVLFGARVKQDCQDDSSFSSWCPIKTV